jgi:hypothetical protein
MGKANKNFINVCNEFARIMHEDMKVTPSKIENQYEILGDLIFSQYEEKDNSTIVEQKVSETDFYKNGFL